MNKIINNIFERELYYKNTVILKYKIEFPQISFSRYEFGKDIFNNYNRAKALKLKLYCENELYEEARQLYEYNVSNGYPVMSYEVILSYEITYNQNQIISMYSDEYIFSGGAHGNTIRSSQNWNLQTGSQIPLAFFYPNNPYYLINILKEINKQIENQIEEGTNQYFDNYCQLVLETFNLDSYYIKNGYIVIFFQQYDIAPYSSGIPVFKIYL